MKIRSKKALRTKKNLFRILFALVALVVVILTVAYGYLLGVDRSGGVEIVGDPVLLEDRLHTFKLKFRSPPP